MDEHTYSKQALSARVRRALEDMAVIRHSLMGVVEQGVSRPEEQQNILDIELAAELKSVVDAMRQMLWAYIQALSVKSGRTPQQVMEWYKMELAVEMLRSARSRNLNTAPANAAEEQSWSFDKLYHNALEVSELHHDKHQ